MIEIILALITYQFVFAGLFFWYVRHQAKQQKETFRAFLSRDAYEFTETTLREKPAPEEKPPEYIPMENLSDDDFNKAIKKQLEQ